MDFLDEDAKPRFLFQSRAQQQASSSSSSQISDPAQTRPQPLKNKVVLFISISISILIFALTFIFINSNSEPISSLLFWVASSLLLGPFAPTSLTAGDIRVGQGPIVQFVNKTQDQDKPHHHFKQQSKKATANSRQQIGNSNAQSLQTSEESGPKSQQTSEESGAVNEDSSKNGSWSGGKMVVEEERDYWSEEDFELLKKQMLKHPVGMPRRWEFITAAFNGSHKMESVVKMAKSSSMSEKKLSDGDSFARFLKDRKPLDKRAAEGSDIGGGNDNELLTVGNGESRREKEGLLVWSAEEDIALLNALKAFPKDAPMRWEKIAAAVPGKTKSACMKRVTDLKRDFRNSKASIEA